MAWKPMHDIQISHDWKEVNRIESDSELLGERVLECALCGAHQRAFFFLPEGTSPAQRNRPLNIEAMSKGLENCLEGYHKDLRRLLDSGGYSSQDQLLQKINNQYEHKVDVNSLTLEQLGKWMGQRTKDFKRKAMLLFGQGFVCNRCDSIIHSWDDFEVDHIFPRRRGGGAQLKNLQLLCHPCHVGKGDSLPDDRDVSPFSDTWQQCVHIISCTDLESL